MNGGGDTPSPTPNLVGPYYAEGKCNLVESFHKPTLYGKTRTSATATAWPYVKVDDLAYFITLQAEGSSVIVVDAANIDNDTPEYLAGDIFKDVAGPKVPLMVKEYAEKPEDSVIINDIMALF